jgi:beta-N-acetylhexosaminidase
MNQGILWIIPVIPLVTNLMLLIFVDLYSSKSSKQQAASIVSSAKQVPGLGAAGKNENTHEQLVTINSNLKELQSVDMDPYKTAIATGVYMFMASWAVHPALDAKYPSGFSMA